MEDPAVANELRVLVAAPTRRDGEITCELLEKVGVICSIRHRMADIASELASGAGVIVLTDAALADPGMSEFLDAIGQQPPWSDVPTLLMTKDKIQQPAALRSLERLTNLTLLDRPSSTRALVSAVQSALRARGKQYQIRDQLLAQQRSDEALRQVDKRKDEFLATLAHELRNPLAAIRTGVEVAVRSPGETQRARMVGMIDRQSRMLVKLVDDLMDVSRIATGKVTLQMAPVHLQSVLQAALESGQTLFDNSRHDLQVDLTPNPVWVQGDAARLTQVIGNLLNNAGKYTPDGGQITVSLAQEGTHAFVRVADSGVGIAPDLLEHVFEMFAQVDRTMERSQGGLGIGLSLVRRLVELHGGEVSAESAGVGQGSTFLVRLPAAQTADGADDDAARQEGVVRASSLRVLVVDDNRDVADGLAKLLQFDGHDTRTAYDGASALTEAAAFAPNVVFCDIGLPDMTGHDVAMRLRSDRRYESTLLVAVTGWGNKEDKRQSVQAGFDLHFTKPITREQVEGVLTRL